MGEIFSALSDSQCCWCALSIEVIWCVKCDLDTLLISVLGWVWSSLFVSNLGHITYYVCYWFGYWLAMQTSGMCL